MKPHRERNASQRTPAWLWCMGTPMTMWSSGGAIDAEVGAYEDTTIYITRDGLLEEPACNDAENCTCPYFKVAKNAAKTITAIWRDGEEPSRVFSTDIPHETFTIMEDGEPWCIGIVFSMEHLRGETHE